MKIWIVLMMAVTVVLCAADQKKAETDLAQSEDMLTPAYYSSSQGDAFKAEVDRFISHCRHEIFHHPLQNESGHIPPNKVHGWGAFGAGKPPWRSIQHHPAADFKVNGGETEVALYAAHDGRISTFRDAPKYRHYLAITKEVVSEDGELLGKLVTLYGHIDLDLNEADGLFLDGKEIRKGELVSRHLYSGTKGGPHLHFEIRYYRPGDVGNETFYGSSMSGSANAEFSEASAGSWTLGHWNPEVGYGYADPRNHGIAYLK